MIQLNEKAGRGGNPIRPNTQSIDTKTISFNRRQINGNLPFAAVYSDADPRAADVARVVPRDASIVRIGGAVIGYTRSAPARKTWAQVAAGQRFNELARLSDYRHFHGLDLGDPIAWARVLVDLSYCLHRNPNVQTVGDLAKRLRAPRLDLDLVAAHCSIRHASMSAAAIGEALDVTSCEREECRLLRIDAVDEPAAERRRRLDRERKQRVRFTLKENRAADRARRTRDTGGRYRACGSRFAKGLASTALASRQEPQRLAFPSGGKGQVRTTPGKLGLVPSLIPAGNIADSQPPVCPRFDRPLPLTRSLQAIPNPRRRKND